MCMYIAMCNTLCTCCVRIVPFCDADEFVLFVLYV